MAKTKKCRTCSKRKRVHLFYKDKYTKDKLNTDCKDCYREAQRQYRNNNRQAARRSAKNCRLKLLYGITLDQYLEMCESQGNKCAICLKKLHPLSDSRDCAVDHCHKTGKIRGILCNMCNLALGEIRDCPDNAYQMYEYLWENQ